MMMFMIPMSILPMAEPLPDVRLWIRGNGLEVLLAGFFIIAERQYGFGDLISIAGIGIPGGVVGTVEDVTLRMTKIRTANGEVIITPNGSIAQLTNLSRDWAR